MKRLKRLKLKTMIALKRASNAYLRNFMKIYGPAIEAGLNPFI